ncbi:alpha/beta fold hydrolase [Caballeronia sordidicola]|uniref:alpha/beta fold hydrolase n=1 Tax=Caballeronia sordidicola TaxID=196367 RepID=UPI0004D00871|nr:alpha/beta hydrolase [Caballeronia sordidicola]
MDKATPLVMIHGLMGSIAYFSPDVRMPGVSVHTPDLIGYGSLADTDAGAITLDNQAASVIRYVEEQVGEPCWLLGHSVGGAVAMLVAAKAPSMVRGLISVEGNFTLSDAFWCRKIAALSDEAWCAEHQRMLDDPAAWLQNSGVTLSPQRIVWANDILRNQPRSTIAAMSRAVVKETGSPEFLEHARTVVDNGTPIHLLAGERSASGWDVPDWVKSASLSYEIQPDTGHMMMLEQPEAFCDIVRAMIER